MPAIAGQKIAAFFSHFFDRYKPALLTLLVLAASYYFYFHVIVSENEANLRDRCYRGLHRIASNIGAKLSSYTQQNAGNFLKAVRDSAKTPGDATLEELQRDYGLLHDTTATNDSGLVLRNMEGWKLRFSVNGKGAALADVEAFVAPFLRRDLFTHYFLLHEKDLLFDDLRISNSELLRFLTTETKADTTKTGALRIGREHAVQMGGREYKLFALSFEAAGGRRFTLGGYLPMERYLSEQRYIPTYALLWMVIGLLLVLLMFPLLKIFLMQPAEQLLTRNAIAALAAVHVTGAVAVLVVINMYVYFTFVVPAADGTLKQLAQNTRTLFLNELDSALAEMKKIETAVQQRPALLQDQLLPQAGRAAQQPGADSTPQIGQTYPYFTHVVWTDAAGRQRHRWTTLRYRPQKIDVSTRDYFNAVREGRLSMRGSDSFFLTAVSSWVSTEKLAVLAKAFTVKDSALQPLVMMNLSAPFRSMFNAVMPTGFGFCLLRANGDVMFHLDPARSLNENLLEETVDAPALQAMLNTRSSGYLGLRYAGASHRFYLEPVPGTGFFIATFRDMRLVWSEDLDIISACSILCLLNLAIILVAFLVIQLVGYRQSLLQNQSILFTWLRPNKERTAAYRDVSRAFVASIILQTALFFSFGGENQLALIGTAFSYSYLLISYLYARFAFREEKWQWTARKKTTPTFDTEWSTHRKTALILVLVYIAGVVPFALTLGDSQNHFWLSQILLLLTIAGLQAVSKQNWRIFSPRNFRWWYTSSLFTFVAATAIAPILVFYCLSFTEERLLSLKHQQLRFAQALENQSSDSLSPWQHTSRLLPQFALPYHIDTATVSMAGAAAADTSGLQPWDGFEHLYRAVKPSFSAHSREIENLIRELHPKTGDLFWRHRSGNDSLSFYYRALSTQKAFPQPVLRMVSRFQINLAYTGAQAVKHWVKTLLFFAILLFLLKGFEVLLKHLIHRLFFDGFDGTSKPSHSDLPLANNLPPHENLFVMGPINSGKHEAITKALLQDGAVIIEKDLAELLTKSAQDLAEDIDEKADDVETADKRCVVLLRHFEISVNDPAVMQKKLLLLEALLQKRRQIVLLSSRSVDAMSLLDPSATAAQTPGLTDRWGNAMNQFYNLYHQWERPADASKDGMLVQGLRETLLKEGKDNIQRFLATVPGVENSEVMVEDYTGLLMVQIDLFVDKVDKECAHSDFLWSLRPALFAYIKTHSGLRLQFDFQHLNAAHMRWVIGRHFTALFEQVVLKIQSLASNYYLAIWRGLSRDEQRTLLDISSDDMVNPANRRMAARLANLGLVVPEHNIACYQLMNRSFRNFLYTQLDRAEVKNLEAGASEKNSWSSFQLPVLTVVVALSVFLFTTQQDAFTNLLAYLGAATGAVAAMLRVLGMIPSSKG